MPHGAQAQHRHQQVAPHHWHSLAELHHWLGVELPRLERQELPRLERQELPCRPVREVLAPPQRQRLPCGPVGTRTTRSAGRSVWSPCEVPTFARRSGWLHVTETRSFAGAPVQKQRGEPDTRDRHTNVTNAGRQMYFTRVTGETLRREPRGEN